MQSKRRGGLEATESAWTMLRSKLSAGHASLILRNHRSFAPRDFRDLSKCKRCWNSYGGRARLASTAAKAHRRLRDSSKGGQGVLPTFLLGSGALGIVYFGHWSYENLSSKSNMKSSFKVPFLINSEVYLRSNLYFSLACAIPFLQFAPGVTRLASSPSLMLRYGMLGTFVFCSITGLCGTYYQTSKKRRETKEDSAQALKEFLFGVGLTVPFYALALKRGAFTLSNKLGCALFFSVMGVEAYHNSKLMVRQSYMRKAMRSNDNDASSIDLDVKISSLLDHPSRRFCSFRHPDMLNNMLAYLGIAMSGAGALGFIFGPLLYCVNMFDNIDQQEALLMIGEKERRMKNAIFPMLSPKALVEKKMYLEDKILPLSQSQEQISGRSTHLDTGLIRGTWIVEESHRNNSGFSLSNLFFPSRDHAGSTIAIARCPPHAMNGDLLMSLDDGKRAFKAVLIDRSGTQLAKYQVKPWLQPTGEDDGVVSNFFRFLNPKLHLDANFFVLNTTDRELCFIDYGEFNYGKDEYLVITNGNARSNYYILSRKGNMKNGDSAQGLNIYKQILQDLHDRGFL